MRTIRPLDFEEKRLDDLMFGAIRLGVEERDEARARVLELEAELARLREALVEERTKFLHSRRLDRGDASTWEAAKVLARQTLTAEGLLPPA